ncbi:MAG TPA: DNA glycosylase, partial [Microbacterium sp.]|nr:DNA glycosylase [Microbacterium sp.]
MPEGDTVFRAARRLADVLDGRELARFDLRVPQVATVDLTGATVQEVVPRGKHLLHRIDGWTLHTHLKMEGEWHVYERGGR